MEPTSAARAITRIVSPKLLDDSAKRHFSKWLAAVPDRLHFAAHSHHPWPDVSFEAQIACWNDAARLADFKWEEIFGEVIPHAQRHVAQILNLSDPSTIAWATSTHEFVMRALSSIETKGLSGGAPLHILTTDSEFHSFVRQSARLEEAGLAVVHRLPVEPFESFGNRFVNKVRENAGQLDVIYVSHVFYNSGFIFEEIGESIAAAREAAPRALFIADGYHSFMSMPVDWSSVEDHAFYLAGGYKYAMAGEGVCLMHCPKGWSQRPVHTGWFAGFGDLTKGVREGAVPYSEDAFRMWGATYDPVGLYRFNAVQDLWKREGLSVERIHAHARALQEMFLDRLAERGGRRAVFSALQDAKLLPSRNDVADRGNFLTFQTPRAGELYAALRERNIVTDYRKDRLRFGFGVAQGIEEVERLMQGES